MPSKTGEARGRLSRGIGRVQGDMQPNCHASDLREAAEKAYWACTTSIYFVSCGAYIKIGVAVDPTMRLRDLQIGCPYELTLEAFIVTTRRAAFRLERELHGKFDERSIGGEWFHLSLDDVRDALPDLSPVLQTVHERAMRSQARLRPTVAPAALVSVPRGKGIDLSGPVRALGDLADKIATYQALVHVRNRR